MSILVSDIGLGAAILCGDAAQEKLTTLTLLPLIKRAYRSLQYQLSIRGLPLLEKIATTSSVEIAAVSLAFPSDLVDLIKMEEREYGSSDDYVPVTKLLELPQRIQYESLSEYEIREDVFYFVGATTKRQLRLTYMKSLAELSGTSSVILISNSQNYLEAKTAELATRYVLVQPSIADDLETREVKPAFDEVLRINLASMQDTPVRRKPYNFYRKGRV